MEINENGEATETYNDELVNDAANDAPPPQDAMTTTTADATKDGGEDDNVGAKEGDDEDEVDGTNVGEEGGEIRRSKTATAKKRM